MPGGSHYVLSITPGLLRPGSGREALSGGWKYRRPPQKLERLPCRKPGPARHCRLYGHWRYICLQPAGIHFPGAAKPGAAPGGPLLPVKPGGGAVFFMKVNGIKSIADCIREFSCRNIIFPCNGVFPSDDCTFPDSTFTDFHLHFQLFKSRLLFEKALCP